MKTLEYYKTRKLHPTTKTNAYRLMEDTPESNYWLGYLLADGWFGLGGQINFDQSGRDKKAVLDFAKFIDFQGTIGVRKNGHSIVVKFTDPELCRDYCQKWNIARGTLKNKTTKTYTPSDFDYIKNKLVCYLSFLAGFISGDGTICKRDAISYIEIHQNWLPFLQNINPKAKLIGVDVSKKSRSTDPLLAHCHIGVDQMQEIYQTCLKHKIPLVEEKWKSVPARTQKIQQKTSKMDNRRTKMQGLVAAGWLQKNIAKKFDISEARVSMILNGSRR